MSASNVVFETGHSEMIHDVQFDYYGKRVATASSDRTIKISDVSNEQCTLLAELRGHEGPVWQVAWSHPKYGSCLASCSYDGHVLIWKEVAENNWQKIFDDSSRRTSVNSVAWAPAAYGLILGAAASDGTILIFTYVEESGNWRTESFPGHTNGANSISWCPDVKSDQPADQPREPLRFVTAGCDKSVRLWSSDDAQRPNEQTWKQDFEAFSEGGHADWVRDAQWAPGVGLQTATIASCSEDQTVIIWSEQNGSRKWKAQVLHFDQKVWRVSWSVMGNILAVSQGDNQVSLWKEGLDGVWKTVQ